MSGRNRLRRLAGRVADHVVLWAPSPPPGLRDGRSRPDGQLRDPVLVLATRLPAESLEPLVEQLARVVEDTPGLGLVLVMDQPRFALARRAGLLVEQVIAETDWRVRHPDQPWEGHLAVRLRQLQDLYRTRRVLVAGDLGEDLIAQLRRPAQLPPLRRLARRVVASVVRQIDPPSPSPRPGALPGQGPDRGTVR